VILFKLHYDSHVISKVQM